MLISALVLNYRSAPVAVNCVEALLSQTVAGDLEVIVIDNGSGDGSAEDLRKHFENEDRIRVIETEKNLGFGGGYNYGAAQAKGEYLLINNPAKVLNPKAVEIMLKRLQSDSGIGLVAPRLRYDDHEDRPSPRAFPSPLDVIAKRTWLKVLFPGRMRRYLQLEANPDEERAVDWLAGGCFMMSRDLFNKLGGFDDKNFFLFFEDTDLCLRIWQVGKRVVYLPAAEGTDKRKRLSDGSVLSLFTTRVGREHLKSGLKYFKKWGFRPPKVR